MLNGSQDDDWTYTAQDLPHWVQEAFDVVQEENGEDA